MGQLNQMYLLGNLTRDPEIKFTNEGVAICEMGLAINKRWTDKEGKETESVDFFNMTAWHNLAENCANSLKKGDRVLVNGHINLRSWENKEGKKYNIINITADLVTVSLEFNQVKIFEKENIFEKDEPDGKEKVKTKAK